ncbi:MAG: purine nucleoside phosphorylase DeoD-type, partial [Erysipelotrichaceae bacterium]|nr:purine nucleoside phosphorylase DeoD-type [Erysipelotrichaceae bacterium]
IYSYELYKFYGVETIIRIGSAGSYKKELPVRSTVLADSAWSTSSYARTQNGYDKDVTYPCAELNERLIQAAKDLNIPLVVGRINSSDVFYAEETSDGLQKALENNCVCAEMESFALFHNANVLGKKAACLVTISDCLADPSQDTTAEERQTSFTNMMKIALEMAE